MDLLKKLRKKYGNDVAFLLDDEKLNIESISTGSINLDNAIGIGGYPRGRIVEIYGPASSGKTTLALHAVVEAQKEGGMCAYIDAEQSFNKDYAETIGIDFKKLIFVQPSSAEEGLNICQTILEDGECELVVIDSIDALTPKIYFKEDSLSESNVGVKARIVNKAIRIFANQLNGTKTCLLLINQVRENIGGYGISEVTPGGKAILFYSSVRIRTSHKKISETQGEIKASVKKNKVGSPYKVAAMKIIYGKGIDTLEEKINKLVIDGIIEKKGSWYMYEGESIGQGMEKVKDWYINKYEKIN